MSQLSVSPPRNNYNHMSSPASTISDDEDSNHSAPNDLRAPQKSRHHGFGGYASFYSPPQSHGASTGGHSAHPQPQYVATNECRLIDYRGARIAAFLAANRQGEYLLCLPQAFELFLKHLVGGLHTVYTKLKRLDIVPIVCNVEQVRILRGLGAIQPGVNRCKLLSTHDFDVLYKDCTTARPGRPPKRSSGIPSPEPGNYGAATPITNNQQGTNNLLPLLGFSNSKKARYSDDCDYTNENMEMKQLTNSGNVNLSASNNSAATAAAMLAANGYSAAFPFLQHLSAAANSMPNSQQQQQLVAAAAALGLPALPNRFGTNSPPPPPPPPPVPSQSHFVNSGSGGNSAAATPDNADFNPTAAYLWLLSQQQQHLPNAAAAAAALNLTREVSSRNAANSFLNGNSSANNGNAGSPSSLLTNNNNLTPNVHNNNDKELPAENDSKINNAVSTKEKSKNPPVAAAEEHKATNGIASNGNSQMNSSSAPARKRSSKNEVEDDVDDSSEDDDDDDDMVSNNSSNAENPVSSSGFNGIGNGGNSRNHFMESMNSIRSSPVTPQSAGSQNQAQPEHCLETLLRNIEGLLAIAAHNARQQQTQLQLQKAELRAELGTQVDREREMREHVEKQFHEEQKIRIIYQKRFKKERKLRRKLEHELHQNHHQLSSQSQQSAAAAAAAAAVSMNLSASKSGLLGQSNGGATNGPVNTLSALGSTKSPVSSLPPTPPTHTASSDEAE